MKRLLAIFLLSLATHSTIAATPPITAKIMIYKADRKMELLDKESVVLKTYKIGLGSNSIGPKTQQGDNKTPEGLYKISGKNAGSHYHLSLHLSYPKAHDIAQAKKRGVAPGGDIMIHGLPNAQASLDPQYTAHDWTNGCIAVSNKEIEEIWNMVPIGTPVDIRP